MLIKVGSLYLTLGTFTYEGGIRGFVHCFGQMIELSPEDAQELERILDQAIANQSTLQSQIEAVNKQHAELQAKAQEIAAYEQQLIQKAAQVDAAYAAMQQQKSPVILTPGFGMKRK